MAKMIGGPFTAVAVELPPNAPTDCKPGTTGILEIWESQRRTPGKRGVVFNYPLNERDETSRYLHTTYSYDLTLARWHRVFRERGQVLPLQNRKHSGGSIKR